MFILLTLLLLYVSIWVYKKRQIKNSILVLLDSSTLSAAQEEDLEDLAWEHDYNLVFLEDLNPKLYLKLKNCPSEYSELLILAQTLLRIESQYKYVVGPIGSPAFRFLLAQMHGMRSIFPSPIHAFFNSKRITKGSTTQFVHTDITYI